MQRRHFLTLTTVAAGAAFLSQCSSPRAVKELTQLFRSRGGRLRLDLTARPTSLELAGKRASVLAYNQQVPGPQLEVWPGDDVEIHFTNALAEPSNLHFHGLHLPTSGEADNPLRMIHPGETGTYRFTVPKDHRSGTFWYHPHHHGNVSRQVFGGLAGLLIVRGNVDEIPEIQAAQEAFLVLQDFDLDRQGQMREPMPMFRMWGREGDLVTVNGQTAPTLPVPKNGLLRLRVLNASPSRTYQLQLREHPWHLMATDGGPLSAPIEVETWLLAPGERAEFLVPGTRPEGIYDLVSLPYDRGFADMARGMMGQNDITHSQKTTGSSATAENQTFRAIAKLTYQDGKTAPLPKQLIPVEALPEPILTREFVLDHGIDARTRQPFLINGQAFDPNRVDVQAKLDTVEDWWIINKAGLDHPFHLHTNSFQIISRNRKPEPFRAWKDVVNVRAYEMVQIRIPFQDFAGKTVFHCHVLDHEDMGMMGIVEIS
ncbi:MAG TPA: multicopper oxidase family protein [Leptolyngbyaceae cyanobacterium]